MARAGRFDRQVLVDRPDKIGRRQILDVQLRKVILDADASADEIAALTPGFTGADLAILVNEAALVATRRGAETAAMSDFTAAVERIVAGLEKENRLLDPREREIVAYHAMGHALVAAASPGSDAVHKVSIILRGIGALGYAIQRPAEDRYLMTGEELENKMSVLLGGRAAEKIVFGHLSTGAADDLNRVTDIAGSMVMRYGMVADLGHVTYDTDRSGFLGATARLPIGRLYREESAREIDAAVRAIVTRCYARAESVLDRNRSLVEAGARELLAREKLDAAGLAPRFRRISGPAR